MQTVTCSAPSRRPLLGKGSSLHRGDRKVLVRASSELDKLVKPELKRPEAPTRKLFEENQNAQPTSSGSAADSTASSSSKVVTIEYQRQRAKEMTKYFKEVKLQDQIVKSQVFGWTPQNEINNGRWTMFGFAVGLLTEYATGVDFIDQVKLLASYLGIVDLD